jgi:hypothetical protein
MHERRRFESVRIPILSSWTWTAGRRVGYGLVVWARAQIGRFASEPQQWFDALHSTRIAAHPERIWLTYVYVLGFLELTGLHPFLWRITHGQIYNHSIIDES